MHTAIGCVAVRASCDNGRSNCAVSCEAEDGIGEGHAVTLGVVNGHHTATVDPTVTLSYVPPTVHATGGAGALQAATRGGTTVTLTGEGFGPPCVSALGRRVLATPAARTTSAFRVRTPLPRAHARAGTLASRRRRSATARRGIR